MGPARVGGQAERGGCGALANARTPLRSYFYRDYIRDINFIIKLTILSILGTERTDNTKHVRPTCPRAQRVDSGIEFHSISHMVLLLIE